MSNLAFALALRAHAERLGIKTTAATCGVTTRTIQLWLKAEGNPNKATKAGALLLLEQAPTPAKDEEP